MAAFGSVPCNSFIITIVCSFVAHVYRGGRPKTKGSAVIYVRLKKINVQNMVNYNSYVEFDGYKMF